MRTMKVGIAVAGAAALGLAVGIAGERRQPRAHIVPGMSDSRLRFETQDGRFVVAACGHRGRGTAPPNAPVCRECFRRTWPNNRFEDAVDVDAIERRVLGSLLSHVEAMEREEERAAVQEAEENRPPNPSVSET